MQRNNMRKLLECHVDIVPITKSACLGELEAQVFDGELDRLNDLNGFPVGWQMGTCGEVVGRGVVVVAINDQVEADTTEQAECRHEHC